MSWETPPVDDDAFRDMLVVEIPRLRRLALRVVPAGTDPEDLAQDALERAWQARTSFQEQAKLSTWLHRIVVNRAMDLARRNRPEIAGLDAVTDCDLLELVIEDPDAVLERAADAAQLRAALSRLPTEDRMVLALHDGEGWSAREIAQTCGLTTEATHKRLQRGRLRLARELAAGGSTGTPASPSCLRARTSASDYLDGRLDDARRADVEEHLRHCQWCPPLAQALIGLRAALHEGSYDTDIPATISGYLRRMIGEDELLP